MTRKGRKTMENTRKNKVGFKLHKNRREIIQFCSTHKRIYLYGASYVANMMYEYLRDENIEINGVIVGEGYKKKNKSIFKDIYGICEISEVSFSEEDGIILCVRVELQDAIKKALKQYGIKDEQIYEQKIYANYASIGTEIKGAHTKKVENNNTGYFGVYSKLDGLGQTWNTDKCSKKHNYLNKYEFF